MDTKILSSRQVRWTQKLSKYPFRIDYQQGKTNEAADALSQYPQRSAEEKKTLWAKNTKILHWLQFLLARMSGLSMRKKQQVLSPLHQVLICGTVVSPQLCQVWDTVQSKFTDKGLYTVSIGDMGMSVPELQDDDKKAKKLRSEQVVLEGWEDIEQVLHYHGLLYVPKVIRSELISRYHDDSLAGHHSIEKTCKLLVRKYFWQTLQRDVEDYEKRCNVCLAWKTVCHKPYRDLQSLPLSTHRWKELSMQFITGPQY